MTPGSVDAHHHFILPDLFDYPWMRGPEAVLRRRRGPEELGPHLAACGIAATVVVQACPSTAETAELLRLASVTDHVAGVVGWVELTASEVGAALDHLHSLPGGTRLVGIRHQVHDEADPGWLDRADVRRGLEAVEEAGLAYDALVRERELGALIRLARDRPGLRVVIDHAAKPKVAERAWEPWASALVELAGLANVAVKVSGLVTEADWHHWSTADLRPYVEAVLSWFGPERTLLGSDWPVCELAASYERALGAYLDCLDGLSPAEQQAVRGATARRWYSLADREPSLRPSPRPPLGPSAALGPAGQPR